MPALDNNFEQFTAMFISAHEQRNDFQADCFGNDFLLKLLYLSLPKWITNESHILSPASGGNVTVILLGSSAIIFVTSGQSTAFGYRTLSACERQIAVTNAIVSYLVLWFHNVLYHTEGEIWSVHLCRCSIILFGTVRSTLEFSVIRHVSSTSHKVVVVQHSLLRKHCSLFDIK